MVTPAQPSRRFLAPGDKLGKYEVIRQIAVGGMAELFLTRTVGIEGFEKLVCVKRILPHFADNPSFVNMFLNEARLAATLHHPNIAQVYDIGQEMGEFFFSMEYVHGEDLGRLVATGRENGVPISLDCALTLAAGLCAGLHHAHEKASPDGKPLGVVHLDVSPTNVLVSYDGAVKLVDFGIARAGRVPPSSQTGLKGKISYMSPEQCRGTVTLDRRSDVFSVGTILYELTTGQLPFIGQTEYAVLQQIVDNDATPPSALVQGYPPALEAIVMRALARDPDRRFSTALELQNQLEDYAHDNRLRVSPLVLARLMSTLFPARLEEWDHARSQGAFFVEQHVVRTLIESGKTADSSPGYMPQPLPPVDDASGGLAGPAAPSRSPGPEAMEPTELVERPSPPPQLATPRPGASQPRIPAPSGAQPQMQAPPSGQSQPRIPAAGQLLPPLQIPATVGSAHPQPRIPTAGQLHPLPRIPTTPPGQSQPPQLQATTAGQLHPQPQIPTGPGQSHPPQMLATAPSGPSQPPQLPETAPGQSPSQPRLQIPAMATGPSPQGMSPPPPMTVPAAMAVPTPPPMGVPAPPAGTNVHPPAGRSSSRPAPVPNMPGAVPIMMPLPPPPVPAGGTLVSSATQAGNPPPAVTAGPSRFGSPVPGYGGASYESPFGPTTPPGGYGFGPPVAQGNYAPQGAPGPYGAPQGHLAPPPQTPSSMPAAAGHGTEDVTDQVVRVSARPTLVVRRPRSSRLPLAALAVVGAAGAVVGVWLAIRNDTAASAPTGAAAPAVAPGPNPSEAEAPRPAAAAADPAETPAPATEAPKPATADGRPEAAPTEAAKPPAETTEGSTKVAVPAEPAAPVDAAGDARDPTKRRPAKVVQQDPRTKPARPKGRAEVKRPDIKRPDSKRGQKPEAKEPSWNADSPFLPEATPKR